MSRVHSVPGYDPDDLRQEARLALWQAGDPTGPLASVIVRRRFRDLLRAANREHHRALNEAIRHVDHHGDTVPVLDLVPGGRDPAEIVCARAELRERGAELTDRERRALVYVVAGIPYRRDRRIDNAVTRARRKLARAA